MITLAQIEIQPFSPVENTKKMIQYIDKAKKSWSDCIVFPEMSIPWYLLWDEWENDCFVAECMAMNDEIVKASKGITVIWWNVLVDWEKKWEDGRKRKYNAVFVAANGKYISNDVFHGYTIKTLMPKYREFDDERYFFSMNKLAIEEKKDIKKYFSPFTLSIDGKKTKVWIIICEDMRDDDYSTHPIDILQKKWAELIINVSASPFGIGKQNKRDRLLSEKSKRVGIIYVNHTGIQNNGKNIFVFDGASTYFVKWEKQFQCPSFVEWLYPISYTKMNHQEDIALIYNALISTLQKFFDFFGKKKVVIWLSGGMDSSISAALCTIALGPKRVIAVNMPSRYNSSTTKNIAHRLAKNLWIEYLIFPIQESVDQTVKQFESILWIKIQWLVLENIQARDRWSRLLAWISASLGALFTNNGNKTEIAQGYATLYGDVNGSICPLGDLYKTQVFELAKYINTIHHNMLPEELFTLKPSAELSEQQNVDEGKWDPFVFEYHDKLLYQLIELRKDPEEILSLFAEGKLEWQMGLQHSIIGHYFATANDFIQDLERIYKNFKGSVFKRIQCPPTISISKRAFWYDFRESQGQVWFTKGYEKLKSKLLKKCKK